MKRNLGAKPYLYPMPVLIIAAYDDNGTANAMNAAWCSICGVNKISLCISGAHKTVKNILARKAFTVSIADVEHMIPSDYVGIVSGNDEPNKMEKAGFTTLKSGFVDAPIIQELPFVLECKMLDFNSETDIMIGEIINVAVEESLLTADGHIDMLKFNPITYDPVNHTYIKLGETVGVAYKEGLKIQ